MDADSDPVALVTGASSGLGRGLARSLAAEGFAVGLVARREDQLEIVAREILDAGGRVAVLPADVSSRTSMHRVVGEAEAELGPIELLVANAGIKLENRAGYVDANEVESVMGVNFLGAVYAVEAVLPGMRERRDGQLACVSSIAAFGGLPGAAAYSASKAALTSYFESLRIELGGSGIDVTVLSPGFVRTPMTAERADQRPFLLEADDAADRMLAAILAGKRSHTFPWTLATLAHAGRLLPRSMYDAILRSRR